MNYITSVDSDSDSDNVPTRYDILYDRVRRYFAEYATKNTVIPMPAPILFDSINEDGSVVNATLWLGSAQHVTSKATRLTNIKYVFNVTNDDEAEDIQYDDDLEVEVFKCFLKYNMRSRIRRGVELYQQCLESGKPLLVHCLSGRNRGATVVVGIVMAIKRIPVEEAIEYVRKYHIYAAPQHIRELFEFEKQLGIPSSI